MTPAIRQTVGEARPVTGDDLGAAWGEAEAALPEGWSLSAGSILNDRTHGRRVVYWAGAGPLTEDPDTLIGGKASPATALRDLASRLRAAADGSAS